MNSLQSRESLLRAEIERMSYYFFCEINQAVQKLASIKMRMMIEIYFFLYTTSYYYNSIILAFHIPLS